MEVSLSHTSIQLHAGGVASVNAPFSGSTHRDKSQKPHVPHILSPQSGDSGKEVTALPLQHPASLSVPQFPLSVKGEEAAELQHN